jgi:uncharacterized protein involved in oxidation of intracellular sulfur
MRVLYVLNDPPHGTERCYNALRLAHALARNDPEVQIVVFLMADAAAPARNGQKTPEGYYKIERMLRRFAALVLVLRAAAPVEYSFHSDR